MYCIVNSIDPLDLKEDDNDSDCSDSWELLDYEKEVNNTAHEDTDTLNKGEASQPEKDKSTSTKGQEDGASVASAESIRQQESKSRSQSKNKNNNNNNSGKKNRKQKQKVSFEIPDLVKEEGTIELTTPNKEANDEKSSNRQSSSNGASSERTPSNESSLSCLLTDPAPRSSNINQKICAAASKVAKQKNKKKLNDSQVISVNLLAEPTEIAQAQPSARAPILNYAAALTAKLDKGDKSKHAPKTLPEKSSQLEAVVSQSKGVVKRNRPVSSSSWSSCDDDIIREISLVWEEDEVDKDVEEETAKSDLPTNIINNNNNDVNDVDVDDGLSMISSGFSDCDYGFGGISDYVMRPKKSQAKRRRNASSTSSSLLTSMSKRGSERVVETTTKKGTDRAPEEKDSNSRDSAASHPAIRWETVNDGRKRIKPKKKKLILSSPSATQSDFLKRPIKSVAEPSSRKSSLSDDQTATKTKEVKTEQASKVDIGQQLMPPPSSMPPSSTDSSDIPDMDESWYLTPPPCFTGVAANKLCKIPKPKAREAARENLLIEHPPIYIASTSSKQVTLPSKKSSKEILVKQKAIVLKKVSSKQPSSFNTARATDTEKRPSLGAAKITADKKSVKCWDNKFVVTNWDEDEFGDINDDFDDSFPALEKQEVASKITKSATREKPKQKSHQVKETRKSGKKTDIKTIAITSTNGHESDFTSPSPFSLDDGVEVDRSGIEKKNVAASSVKDENLDSKRRRRNQSSSSEPKVPVKVEPIEPERQPGWQLKKKRSKRRPLVHSTQTGPTPMSSIKHSVSSGKLQTSPAFSPYGELSCAGSEECSARSTPTLINRIGSSIVANLSNLTSGFASSTGMNTRAPLSEVNEKMNHIGLVAKSESELNSKARKQMSKGFLNRQNSCLKVGNSARRADRRAKMHTTPNGVSINRKVQSNFH